MDDTSHTLFAEALRNTVTKSMVWIIFSGLEAGLDTSWLAGARSEDDMRAGMALYRSSSQSSALAE